HGCLRPHARRVPVGRSGRGGVHGVPDRRSSRVIDEFDALSVELRVHEAAIRVMNATPDATEPHDVERLRGVPFIELLAEESGFSEVEVWNIVTQPGYAIRTMRGGSKATLHPGDRVLYGDDDDEPWIAHVVEVLDEHRLRLSVDG